MRESGTELAPTGGSSAGRMLINGVNVCVCVCVCIYSKNHAARHAAPPVRQGEETSSLSYLTLE